MEANPIRDLAKRVKIDPEYAKMFAEDPVGELKKAAEDVDRPAYMGDKWIYRLVVLALTLVVLIAAVGAIVLSWNSKGMPESLIALGSASIGASAGLLAPSPVRSAPK
jgi:uncharacterized ion transporter superfamily protein YfcC